MLSDVVLSHTRGCDVKTQNMPWLARVLLSATGGAALLFSIEPYAVWPLAWVGVALGLWALRGAGFWAAFFCGLAYGAALFFPLVTWTSPFLGPLPWLALATAETVLTAIASLLIAAAYRWVPSLSAKPAVGAVLVSLAASAAFVSREVFLGGFPYSGFPWARIAMSQSNSPFAESVSWISISGLSWAIAFSCALVIEACSRRVILPALVAVVGIIGLAVVPMFPTTVVGTVRIAAVQPDSPAGFFDERERYGLVDSLLATSAQIEPESVQLVVWPEGFDGDPFSDAYLADTLAFESQRLGAPLLANAAVKRGEEVFNTSFLWTQQTALDAEVDDVQSHAKRNPVPFGEYVPDRWFYEKIVPDLVGLIGREYTPGTDAPLIDVDVDGERVRVALAICFDVIYDAVIREGIAGGGELFVFQTNNADFRGTPESEQQLAFARMRAFETGRAVVNISTIGTSAIVGADGEILQQLDADTAGILDADIERRTGITLGVRSGAYVELAALVIGCGLILAGAITTRRKRKL